MYNIYNGAGHLTPQSAPQFRERGVAMSYIALYREWRPKTFHEIIGQDHLTRTLKNQIKQGRVAHAYLFCGTRGTGKTTTAKVLAKAVNCLHPKDGEPCGQCEICTAIDDGSIMDVIEIDAASNNGVDNIRELRDDVKYLPSKCRFKVYIIDEVHMLSTAAFNALLKTLEEPPAHVVFILATTEFHKVPATIVSRCQRFDFKRIKLHDIIARLKRVCDDAGVDVDEKALAVIARSADGAMRDALSILDQCISLGGSSVAYDDVLSILGITTDEYLFIIADSIAAGNAPKCIMLIDELITGGKDVYQFIKDLTLHFRNLLICRMGDNALDILNVSEEVFREMRSQTKKFSTESILRNINILSASETDAKWVSQPRIILETAVLRMCKRELGTDVDSLLERIAKLEDALAGNFDALRTCKLGEQGKSKLKPADRSDVLKQQVKNETKYEAKTALKPGVETAADKKPSCRISLKEVSEKWPKVLDAVRSGSNILFWSNVKTASLIGVSDGVLTLGFEHPINKGSAEEPNNRKILEDSIESICGCRLKVKCILQDEVAADKQKEDSDEIVRKAISVFGEDLVEVEE